MALAQQRHGAKKLGFAYWLVVVIVKPTLLLITKRRRRGLDYLSADYPPHDGIIVAANHISWFDPLNVCHVLWDAGRPPRFMAKDPLFRIPFVGWIMRNAGQIPVYRESSDPASAIRDAIAALDNGEAVLFYPEGTMTRDKDFWPMTAKSGAAKAALLSGAPVIPLAQWGPEQVMRPYKKEFKILPRKAMITYVGPPVDLDDLRGKEMTTDVVREAAERIIVAITSLLEEVRQETAPAQRLSFQEWRKDQEAAKVAEVTADGDSPDAPPDRRSA